MFYRTADRYVFDRNRYASPRVDKITRSNPRFSPSWGSRFSLFSFPLLAFPPPSSTRMDSPYMFSGDLDTPINSDDSHYSSGFSVPRNQEPPPAPKTRVPAPASAHNFNGLAPLSGGGGFRSQATPMFSSAQVCSQIPLWLVVLSPESTLGRSRLFHTRKRLHTTLRHPPRPVCSMSI